MERARAGRGARHAWFLFGAVLGCERFSVGKHAMRELDPKKIEPLIAGLESEDSFERLGAIEELQDLTQHTFGFRFNDPLEVRSTAIERWKRWLKEHQREREKTAQWLHKSGSGSG